MLQAKNLSKKYNGKTALDHVNVEMGDGKIYAFLGPNGSGKTTFMKIIASLTKQSEGELLLDGKALSIKSRADVAYLPTETHAYPFMTVGEFGEYYKTFFKDFDEIRYKSWVERMKIPFRTPFKVLSSGMDKKVRVAATLAREAKVLILDEPFNGVDLLAREEIEKMILEVMSDGRTIILSSHLVEEVESYVNFALFFNEGRLLAMEDVEELRSSRGMSITDRYRELLGRVGE
ncbi:MAG: ABC transporter ATP-binding protein [Oribacterium parvum]|jgi:ABC superfamily ATP binding cassette transporter, ABC protein|nr:ABC transporter ATP-binding protein [Oribacterium parvum]MBF1269183.1 ABC transporter ATP-binding protein [Oribacterium parvum]